VKCDVGELGGVYIVSSHKHRQIARSVILSVSSRTLVDGDSSLEFYVGALSERHNRGGNAMLVLCRPTICELNNICAYIAIQHYVRPHAESLALRLIEFD
jgi:hypothetical protein